MKKLQIAIMAAALIMAVQARAAWYDLTYTDGGANVGSGQINVSGGVAVSGFFNVTAGTAFGSWTLSPGPGSAPSFTWDNNVYPNATPFLDGGGLLFTGTQNGNPAELNLWGNSGPTDYSFQGNNGGLGTYGNNNSPVSSGTATLTAVPEASTLVAGALMLLPFGVSTLRIMRKKVTA